MKTLRERCLTEDFGFARNNFIDYFSMNPCYEMIEDSILDIECLNEIQKSYLAATVDQMCCKFHVDRPSWIFDSSTYLKRPYFSMNAKGDLRIILIQESPCWYRSRNIFVSKNCAERI